MSARTEPVRISAAAANVAERIRTMFHTEAGGHPYWERGSRAELRCQMEIEAALTPPPMEVAAVEMFEMRADGTHVPVIPPAWLDAHAKAVLCAVLRCADLDVAIDVAGGALHPGTALAVLHLIADKVRPLDAQLAEDLIPRRTEEAAKR